MLASTVMDEAAAMLNDQAKATFTYTNMLPFLSKANDELETELALNGVSVLKQVSSNATIAVGISSFPSPADLMLPEWMGERLSGSTDPFDEMTECSYLPEELAGTDLNYWAYLSLVIKVGPANGAGATTERQCKLNYTRLITALTGQSSVVEVTKSKTFLAERTAALAAQYVGENDERASKLDFAARGMDGHGGSLANIVALFVRNNQGLGTRRRGYTRGR